MNIQKTICAVFGFLLLAVLPVSAQNFLEKKEVSFGKPVSDFTLANLEGKNVTLSNFKGKIVLLHFWSATCPFVVRYEERLQALTRDYAEKEVVVLGIDSNATESSDKIQKEAKKRGVNYPILIDEGNKIADQFGAVTTPHVYIIDREGKLAYEGSVDDQGWSEDNPVKQHFARDALQALIAGQTVLNPKTDTFGCTVKRK